MFLLGTSSKRSGGSREETEQAKKLAKELAKELATKVVCR